MTGEVTITGVARVEIYERSPNDVMIYYLLRVRVGVKNGSDGHIPELRHVSKDRKWAILPQRRWFRTVWRR